jgi:4-amino-4-deoxy-L-arabinose transferase-like glycosyltransferase
MTPLALFGIVAALTVIRLVLAAWMPLAPDEAYYWVWSRALAPGYLDHPPMVALWIRAGTALAGQTAFGVRLLGPIAAAAASALLFDAARLLFPGARAGTPAVLLLNASLLLGVGSIIMTPDSPLLFFWTAALWAMARLAAGGSGGWWLAAGVFAGLALDSKYTAVFLPLGIGLWTLLVPRGRAWLRRWQPWVAVLIGLLLFCPVVGWNAAHDWAGFVKQGGRVDDWQPMRAFGFLAELFGGQIGLATPLVFALCMAGLAAAVRRGWRGRDPAWSLLAALSLPAALVFLQHATGGRVQGNWPAIIYPALAIAAGGIGLTRRWWAGAAALGFAITAVAYVQAATDLVPLPPKLDPVAIRFKGWDGLMQQVQADRAASGADFVAAEGYTLASELAWQLPATIRVMGFDARWALTNLPKARIAGQTGLLLRDIRRTDPLDPAVWTSSERIGTVERFGAPASTFSVYRVVAAGASGDAVEMPHR